MSDLISRQAAIDAMDECYWSIMGDEPPKLDEKTALYVDLTQAVKRLPSAQPEPIKINIDHELTKDEYEKLRKDLADAPVVLLPTAQPEIIRCGECKNHIDGRCIIANHHTSVMDNCGSVMGAERREDG